MPFWWPKKKQKAAAPRSDVREFIRHTVDVPLQFRALEGGDDYHLGPLPDDFDSPDSATSEGHSRNVGFGGLAFESNFCPNAGQLIELRIPTVDPPFVAKARVAWCRPGPDGGYLIGASFLDASDAFKSRMVQQVCSIENYRKEVKAREGRELTTQEASTEWITKFAGRFPTSGAT